jgi:hypothetical protein
MGQQNKNDFGKGILKSSTKCHVIERPLKATYYILKRKVCLLCILAMVKAVVYENFMTQN